MHVPVTADSSEVSQFEGNDHHHTIGMVGLHTNHGKLGIGIIQVEYCQLAKDFGGPPVGNRALVRKLIKGWSGAHFCLLNFIIKCVNRLLVEGMVRYMHAKKTMLSHTGTGGAA